MSASGNQVREQMLGVALQNVDTQEREIAALQIQVAELQKQLAASKQETLDLSAKQNAGS